MDFARYVESFQSLYLEAKSASEPRLAPLSDQLSFTPRKILILAPHPDDECLMGGFALRAQEEFHAEVKVLPFSYGSKKERRSARRTELKAALQILNFHLLDPRGDLAGEKTDEELTLSEFSSALDAFSPDLVIAPHHHDGHPAHIRAAQLAMTRLPAQAKKMGRPIWCLQSEFWQSMERPNLFLPLSKNHLTVMGEALLAHVGEVSRNPYHLSLPAWAMDQVRRGSEMSESTEGLKRAGAPVASAVFGQLYRLEKIDP